MQHALLMRANKPETAVQSSALFLLHHMDHAQGVTGIGEERENGP